MVIAGVAVGFAIGAPAGARVATRMRGAKLKQICAVIVLCMALLVALRGN